MVGTVVFEENGFPVELVSAPEIERAVASGRLRIDTLVRTGMENGDTRVSAASDVSWLRPFLGLVERTPETPPVPIMVAKPPTADPPTDLARPAGSTVWQPRPATFGTTSPNRTQAVLSDGGHPAAARQAPRPSAPVSRYVEPDGIVVRAFMPLVRYASFEGRSSPREFWAFLVLLMAGLAFASAYAGSTGLLLAAVATALPSLAVLVRRCHDQNRSGWFALIGLVPYVGWLILLVLMIVPGTAGPNRFGINPMGGG